MIVRSIVASNGSVFILDGKDHLKIHPSQIEEFALKGGEEVSLQWGKPYTCPNILAKKVKIGEKREGWQDNKGEVVIIPYKEEIEAYQKDFMRVTRRSISDYINRDND